MRRIIRVLFGVALTLGLSLAVTQPASAGVLTGFQVFKVAKASKDIKVSSGLYGLGLRQTVDNGRTAKIKVVSVKIPGKCALVTKYKGITRTTKNTSKTAKWKNGLVMGTGTTTARIVCFSGGGGGW